MDWAIDQSVRRIDGREAEEYDFYIHNKNYFFGELNHETGDHIVSTEGISRWFTLSELSALEMPYTAKFVIEHYLRTGRRTKDMYVGVADGKCVSFTQLPEYSGQ